MAKFSKYLQGKKKTREKKRAKRLKNVKPAAVKHELKAVAALQKSNESTTSKTKKVVEKTKPKIVAPSDLRSDVSETPTKKQARQQTPQTQPLDEGFDLLNEQKKSSNKRWKKLKAELREKKKKKQQATNSLKNSAADANEKKDGESASPDETGASDFKSMLMSSVRTVSHRRAKKREWRRQMKRLQRLKVKWMKEGKVNIEELVAKWRKEEQHNEDLTNDRLSPKAKTSAAENTASKNTDITGTGHQVKPGRKANQPIEIERVDDEVHSGSDANLEDADSDVEQMPRKSLHQTETQLKTRPGTTNKPLQRLRVAQFRIINETLYTSKSEEAEELFKNDASAFEIYHEGYRSQVSKWPINPVDRLIEEIRTNIDRKVSIADLGCGDAKLAKTLKPLGYKVHSFDLVSTNEHVVACNVKDLPLADGQIDVAVMCLSLMGTDMGQFVLEANRILKLRGTLKIAEVESRIPSVEGFIKIMKRYGFSLNEQNTSHNMFVFFDFSKTKSVPKGAENNMDKPLWLKACLYKKR